MSNSRLSTESSSFYKKKTNNANKSPNPFVSSECDSIDSELENDSSVSDNTGLTPTLKAHRKHQSIDKFQVQVQEGNCEFQDDFNGFSPQMHQTKTQPKVKQISTIGQENTASANTEEGLLPNDSYKRKSVARRTPAEKKKELGVKSNLDDSFQEFESMKSNKKTKPPVKTTGKTKTKNSSPVKRRGKKNDAENPSSETRYASEPAAKRPRVVSKTKTMSTTEPAPVPTEYAEDDKIPRKNARGNNVSKNVDEAETDVLATKSERQPTMSVDTTREKKGRGRPKKSVSAECVSVPVTSSPTKSLDNHKKGILKGAGSVEAKTPQVENQEANEISVKATEKSKDRNYHFLSSSESEVEDEEDEEDEDDFIFFSNNSSRKTKSPKSAVTLPCFQTQTKGTNKASALVSPETPKSSLLPEPVLLLRTPMRTLSLAREFSPNRSEQSSSAEDVAGTTLYRGSTRKTPLETTNTLKTLITKMTSNKKPNETVIPKILGLTQLKPSTSPEKSSEETPVSKRKSFAGASKTPSPTKRLQSRLRSSQQANDPENDIYGDDSGLIQAVQKRTQTMFRSESSTNHRITLRSAINPSTLPVPNRSSPERATFNLYMAPLGDPVRAQQLLSNAEYNVSWIHLLPKMIFPLKIHNPMLALRLKGSVEFRSDPHTSSVILLNSSTRLVDLKVGHILHVVNTGKEVASFQLTEFL